MINKMDKQMKIILIALVIFLMMFLLAFINSDTLFLFKPTKETTGVMKNIDLSTGMITVEYEVEGKLYTSEIEREAFEKWKTIELLYNPNNPEEVMSKNKKSNQSLWGFCIVFLMIGIMYIRNAPTSKKIYDDKDAKIIEGEIFEVRNSEFCTVCLRVKESDKIYYLYSDINLKPIIEKLAIKTLPIYIKKEVYRVDTREIEEKIEIIKEKLLV